MPILWIKNMKAEEVMDSNVTTEAGAPRSGQFRHFSRQRVLFAAAVGIAAALMLLFFSPMEIALKNPQEFTVKAGDMALPLLLCAAAVAAVSTLGLLITLMICEKLFFVLSHLMLGLMLAFYAQTLFLNGSMLELTGDGIHNASTGGVIINAVIFTVITAAPLIIAAVRRKKAGGRAPKGFEAYLPAYICGAVTVMLGIGFTGSMGSAEDITADRPYNSVFTYDPMTSFSKENNVVIFIFDRLDSRWCDNALAEYPDLNEKLAGFTFYQNNMPHYSNTFPSVPSMLTGYYYDDYDNASKVAYLTAAWDRNTLLDELHNNGVKVNLALDAAASYVSADQLEGRCDNLMDDEHFQSGFNYFGEHGILLTMSKLSMARLAPYCLKSVFAGDLASDLSSRFIFYDSDAVRGIVPAGVGVGSDKEFYNFISGSSFDADSSSPVFDIIHLNGAHSKDEEITAYYCGDKEVETTLYTTIRGEFEIIFRYLDEMKRLGVYDNSTVIIMADHGKVHTELDLDRKDRIEHENVAALLIKPANAGDAPLKTDSVSELSNDYTAASVLGSFGLDHSGFGYSFEDIVNGQLHVTRYFNPFRWSKGDAYAKLSKYRVTGDARDFSNWEEYE